MGTRAFTYLPSTEGKESGAFFFDRIGTVQGDHFLSCKRFKNHGMATLAIVLGDEGIVMCGKERDGLANRFREVGRERGHAQISPFLICDHSRQKTT